MTILPMQSSHRVAAIVFILTGLAVVSAPAESFTNANYNSYDNPAQGAATISPFASTFGTLSEQDLTVETGFALNIPSYDFRGLTATAVVGQTYFFLEDLQDGQFDAPGATLTAAHVRTNDGRNGSVNSGGNADSIDEDDGAVDGSVNNPRGGIRFGTRVDFNAGILGDLPTHVGYALAGDSATVSITAFNSSDVQLETATATADVRTAFVGVISTEGISYVILTGSETDHFQYGRLGGAEVRLDDDSIVSNASPGSVVGNIYTAGTNGTFSYSVDTTSGDYTYFDIASGSTNLRTAKWIDSASYDVYIVGTEEGGGGLVVTNGFTITVDAVSADKMSFVVSAEVQSGAANGVLVGTAQADRSGANFSIIGGRTDLFYMDGADLKLTNAADWGGVGTTNYVTLQASAGAATNELVVAAGIVSGATAGTMFLFR